MRVGLIGFGAIAQRLLCHVRAEDDIQFVGAVVRDPLKPRAAVVPICRSVAELLARGPEVVVECGGHTALRAHGAEVLRAGVDLVVVSVGALAEPEFECALRDAARAGKSVPGGSANAPIS